LNKDQSSGAASESVIHSFSFGRKIEKAHCSFGQPGSDTSLSDPKWVGPVVCFSICNFVAATYGPNLFDLPQVFCSGIQSCDCSIYLFAELAAQSLSYIIGAAA
jgi:hypothetical protein